MTMTTTTPNNKRNLTLFQSQQTNNDHQTTTTTTHTTTPKSKKLRLSHNNNNDENGSGLACFSPIPSSITQKLHQSSFIDASFSSSLNSHNNHSSHNRPFKGHISKHSGFAYIQNGNQIYLWSVLNRCVDDTDIDLQYVGADLNNHTRMMNGGHVEDDDDDRMNGKIHVGRIAGGSADGANRGVITLEFPVSIRSGVVFDPLIAVFCPIAQSTRFASVVAVSCEGRVRFWPSVNLSDSSVKLKFVDYDLNQQQQKTTHVANKKVEEDEEKSNKVEEEEEEAELMVNEANMFVRSLVDEEQKIMFLATADGKRVERLAVFPSDETVESTTIYDESAGQKDSSTSSSSGFWGSLVSWVSSRTRKPKSERCIALLPSVNNNKSSSVISLTNRAFREYSAGNVISWHFNAKELIQQALYHEYQRNQSVWLLNATNDAREEHRNIIYLVTAARAKQTNDELVYHMWVINSSSSEAPVESFHELNVNQPVGHGLFSPKKEDLLSGAQIFCALSNNTPILFVVWKNRFVWLGQDEDGMWECAPHSYSLSNSDVVGVGVLKMRINKQFGDHELLYVLNSKRGVLIANIQTDGDNAEKIKTPILQSSLEINAAFREINVNELLLLVQHYEKGKRDGSLLSFGLNVSATTLCEASKRIANAKVDAHDIKNQLKKKQEHHEFFIHMLNRAKHSETGNQLWKMLSKEQKAEILYHNECLLICLNLMRQRDILDSRQNTILEHAITKCEEKRECNRVCGVKNNELFFSDVSLVLDVYEAMLIVEQQKLSNDESEKHILDEFVSGNDSIRVPLPSSVVLDISTVYLLLTNLIETVVTHRAYLESQYQIKQNWGAIFSKFLWTQFEITGQLISSMKNPSRDLGLQMFGMADSYLFSKYELSEIVNKQALDELRSEIINRLVVRSIVLPSDMNCNEKVLSLAKKYKDIDRLVHWCHHFYEKDGSDRLEKYISDFKNDLNLMHQVLDYYWKHERFDLLLTPKLVHAYPDYIADLIKNRPDLKWMFALERNKLLDSVGPLLECGTQMKHDTSFSIMKLVGIAEEDNQTILTAEQNLLLIRAKQELEKKLGCTFSSDLNCADVIMQLCRICTQYVVGLTKGTDETRENLHFVLLDCIQIGFDLYDQLQPQPAKHLLTMLWLTAWKASFLMKALHSDEVSTEEARESILYCMMDYTYSKSSRMTEEILDAVKNGVDEDGQVFLQEIYDLFMSS